jgi:hypothetical protein
MPSENSELVVKEEPIIYTLDFILNGGEPTEEGRSFPKNYFYNKEPDKIILPSMKKEIKNGLIPSFKYWIDSSNSN